MQVQEAAAIYSKYETQIRDNISIVFNARKGLSTKAFYDIVLLSGFKKEQLAELFHTSLKTINRYYQSEKNLDAASSEQALKIIALFKKGTELFGDLDAFRRWITKPAFGIGWQTPLDLMQTSGGIDLVMEELYRIEYGATA
ncbi:putative toxin-antitoxin system antitoxin component, TIGR02293 family [Pseudarcicella hirudinis]|uniref:Putative toxin-antitoxin system antitoxin component, TIGR02293 family n=1 Tax=Pseudarcicella hirudinis TaxID=1079859 RepID=A0A1I5USE8_9BACT|nr:antitoxin Xre/MbcA/ParS toxin-binding domain-containing protein [Pseudarcicella hirudinis]SFP98181.1 putative toxin-antitoxin system antitoxin component, TIGR02293 family [Pseudarcicella hirudinis]